VRLPLVTALLLFGSIRGFAQAPPPETRTDEIEAERQAKQAAIASQPPDASSHNLLADIGSAVTIWNFTQVGGRGLSLRLGGLATGSGFALGPEYVVKQGDLYDPDLVWSSFAVGSAEGYYKLQTGIQLPRLLDDHAYFSFDALRFDYPRLDFYGPGPDSAKTGRSDYRMQNNEFDIRGGLRIAKHLQVGLIGSFRNIHLDPGTHSGIAQTALLYTPVLAPGIDRQGNYLSGGFYAEYEGRDAPLDPHSGAYIFTRFQNFTGLNATANYDQFDFDGQQYVPFWNRRRVLALHLKSVLTLPHDNSAVPFFLEPTLGGPNDLRGFRPYRFYDRNMVYATAEYRWTVTEALDMAVFADAGKVYRDWNTFSLGQFQSDVGFGLRAKAGSTVPFRIDFGFSREGVQVWLNFYNVF
jgi:outer membrane protein assembly factor BamA